MNNLIEKILRALPENIIIKVKDICEKEKKNVVMLDNALHTKLCNRVLNESEEERRTKVPKGTTRFTL
jgi:hypothetical protein